MSFSKSISLKVSFFVVDLLLAYHCRCNIVLAFVTNYRYMDSRSSQECSSVGSVDMVGGKGWENNSFLDSLGGSDEDQEKEKASYYEQQESRKAFNKRQEERMKLPATKKFMADYRKRHEEERPNDFVEDIIGIGSYDDPFGGAEANATSSGATRWQGMIAKANRQQQMRGPPGLEQKFAIPLDSPDDTGSDGTVTPEKGRA